MATTPPTSELIQAVADDGFMQFLAEVPGCVAISTYQAGLLCLVSYADGRVRLLARRFERPMGLDFEPASPDGPARLLLATRRELVVFADAPGLASGFRGEAGAKYDALYLPRLTYHTGDANVHDAALTATGPLVAATRLGCIARPSDRVGLVPTWVPPFLSDVSPDDRCHLNGIGLRDGVPAFVTCRGTTDTPGGWRPAQTTGGVVLSVPTGDVAWAGLAMPHSPRWHDGQLWVLNSGMGEVLVGPATSRTGEVVCRLPGYLRGLAFIGPYALVGMCRGRERPAGSPLPVEDAWPSLLCGVALVDTRSGTPVGRLEFTSGCTEVYDVRWLPGHRRPALLDADHPDGGRTLVLPGVGFRRDDVEDQTSTVRTPPP